MAEEITEKAICDIFRMLRAYRVAGSITFHLNADGIPLKQELKTAGPIDSVITVLRSN